MFSLRRRFAAAVIALTAAALAAASCTSGNTADGDAATIPDGVYRAQVSVDDLLDAGLPLRDAEGNGGIQTLTIDGDTVVFSVRNQPPDCHWTLTYEAERVSALHGPEEPNCSDDEPGTELFGARWEMDGDDLVLDVVDAVDPGFTVLFGSQPWVKAE